MKTYLFIDTETTGFAKNGDLKQDGQGRACQIAMILADENAHVLSEFQSLIYPDNWTIGDGAFKVHGIQEADCVKYGVSHVGVCHLFKEMTRNNTTIVAHNEKFDRKIMNIELAYAGMNDNHDTPWECTMLSNKHLANGRWPKLAVAYKHYTGKELSGAHDAMVDTRACMDIFFGMKGITIQR